MPSSTGWKVGGTYGNVGIEIVNDGECIAVVNRCTANAYRDVLKLPRLLPDGRPNPERERRLAEFDATLQPALERARIMAASPEMLAVLENLHADLVHYAKVTEGVWSSGSIAFSSMADDCQRVISKARGE